MTTFVASANGIAPNNGPAKSPARQQCEQQAQQQFHDAVQAENATIPGNLKTAAAEGFVGGLIGGCIAGAVATSPLGPGAGAGCVAAAVPSALWGAVIGPTISFGHSVFSELGMMSAYNNQINKLTMFAQNSRNREFERGRNHDKPQRRR